MDQSTSNPKESTHPEVSKDKEKKDALSSPTRDHIEDTDKFGTCCLCRAKCFKVWCGSIEYLRWTILGLSMLVICLIWAIVLVGRSLANRFVCPNRWLMYDAKCYYFSNENKTRQLSKIFCSLHDALLAIILEPKDMAILQRYQRDKHYWIGLTRGEDGWNWEGGFSYSPQLLHLVDHNSAMKCAYLYNNKAETAHCESLKHWICMKSFT
ncbi:C-type lectin domain family 2 member B-like isoform X2 [Lissotriton helveticus]